MLFKKGKKLKVYSVTSKEFADYGKVLDGYDYKELFDILGKVEIPKEGIDYVASVEELEKCDSAKEMQTRGFSSYPVQLGYVTGVNTSMNCLEYHKSSEYNIASDDIILILGKVQEIENGKYNSNNCKAFFVPKGVGVELYATTLHYAPFSVNEDGYRVICVLPKGTNGAKVSFEEKNFEDKMCLGVNKWLLAHEDASEVKDGAYVGIEGENIKFEDLER